MKSLNYTILGLAFGLCACNAIEDAGEFIQEPLSADQLLVTASPIVVDGKNSNEIIVENHSPITSQWLLDQVSGETSVSPYAYDTLVATKTGPVEILFRGHDALRNTMIEKKLTVNVDIVSNVPADIANRLCIGQEGAPSYYGSDVDYSKIQVIVEKDANGLNGNRVTLINSNPVMTDWEFGGATSNKNIATLYVFSLGETPLKATFTKADGTVEIHEFDPVMIETFTFKPDFLVELTGGDAGERTWTWMDDGLAIYGFGAYGVDQIPSWFGCDPGTLWYFASMAGRDNEVFGGTMTFKITGEVELSSGRKGTYSFDLDAGVPGWSIGKLYLQGTSVLYGFDFSSTTYVGNEAFVYDIVVCKDGSLTLACTCDGRTDAGTFWRFKGF